MFWLREASNFLDVVDKWMNFTYFDAIDSIKSEQDISEVQLSPLTNLDQYNEAGLQPLHYAIQARNELAVDWLLAHPEIRLNAVTEIESWNSAHCAVKFGNPSALGKLIAAGVDLNAWDAHRMTPLAYVLNDDFLVDNFSGDNNNFNLALNPLNFKTLLGPNKRSYYHFWARDSTLSLLHYLISTDQARDINVQDDQGTTALMLAAETGQIGAMRKLIAHGARFELLDELGRSALDRAASAGQTLACQLLLFDPTVIDLEMEEEYLTEIEDITVVSAVDKLVSQSMLFVANKQGWTPLMAAVLNDHVETVRVLVNKDLLGEKNFGHVDLKHEKTGDTALHLSVSSKSPELVSILLEAGAFADPQNNLGKKPIDLAEMGSDLYNLLIESI